MRVVGGLGRQGPESGDGFVRVADGTPRWGRYGAAGLLVRHQDADAGTTAYVVALRSRHTHMGGTWAVPGGALNRDETPIEAAAREFREEIGVVVPTDRVYDIHEDDHGGWSYWTVMVDVADRFPLPAAAANWETADVRWVGQHELGHLDLLPPFRATLIRTGLLPS